VPKTILIADDEPALLRLMEFVLTRHGYALIRATNGEEALELIRAHRPDLAVLDVMMPKRDGLSVTRAVRSEAAIAATPIVLLTARAQDADIAEGVAVGADAYLTKPFVPEQLAQTVASLLDEVPQSVVS
jgi:two-component system, OmpR family, alkaline phosphatase synthesis response regulator PhoP